MGGTSNAKRRRQAKRTAEIYARLVAEGQTKVDVVGDFNDTPDEASVTSRLHATADAQTVRAGGPQLQLLNLMAGGMATIKVATSAVAGP